VTPMRVVVVVIVKLTTIRTGECVFIAYSLKQQQRNSTTIIIIIKKLNKRSSFSSYKENYNNNVDMKKSGNMSTIVYNDLKHHFFLF
jgi:hypothetical protein